MKCRARHIRRFMVLLLGFPPIQMRSVRTAKLTSVDIRSNEKNP